VTTISKSQSLTSVSIKDCTLRVPNETTTLFLLRVIIKAIFIIGAAGAAFAARAAVLAPAGAGAALVGPRQHLLRQHQLEMGQPLHLLRQR